MNLIKTEASAKNAGTNDSPVVKIFTCHHKKTETFSSNCIIPIQAGRAIAPVKLDNMIGDDTGDHISDKNKSYCELTVLYWMWKNVEADYYGLFHYRRFLSFRHPGDGYHVFHGFTERRNKRFGWDDQTLVKEVANWDVITSPVWGIHPVGVPWMLQSNYDFYAKDHYSKDLDIVIELIKERSPEVYPYALNCLYSKHSFFCNMMIMKKEYFFDYCEWLFDILGEAEKRIDISAYDDYQYRIWGFVAERLSNCYLTYLKGKNKDFKHGRYDMVFAVFDKPKFDKEEFDKNLKKQKALSKEIKSEEAIDIVFSIDDNYARHCATALNSILDHANPNQKFRFFVLHNEGNLTDKAKDLLLTYANKNIEMNFVKVDPRDFAFYPQNRPHISVATYYRLAIHKLLPKDVKKAIYLDADLVVVDNIAKLWNEDLGDYIVAGSPDEGGITQIRRLNLPLDSNYINAGICVMNVEMMRKENPDFLYIEAFCKNLDFITLQDQDIINIAYQGRIKRLHVKWNIQSRMFDYNELEHNYSLDEVNAAFAEPGIIHYSDVNKPWLHNSSHKVKYLFQDYASMLGKEWEVLIPKVKKPSLGRRILTKLRLRRR